jgi:hypothetical protein
MIELAAQSYVLSCINDLRALAQIKSPSTLEINRTLNLLVTARKRFYFSTPLLLPPGNNFLTSSNV